LADSVWDFLILVILFFLVRLWNLAKISHTNLYCKRTWINKKFC